MPSHVFSDARCWLDGYDISGDLNAVALGMSVDLRDATTLGKLGRVRRSGIKSAALQLNGFWQANNIDNVLAAGLGVADVPVSVGAFSGTEGDTAYFFRSVEGEYEHGGQVGEMYAFSANAQSSAGEPLVRGIIGHNATKTATGTGTAFNLGAVSATQKVYAALHVLAASGTTPTLDVTIYSDNAVGFPSAVAVASFSQVAAVVGSRWITPVVGPLTDSWWKVGYVIGGGTPSYTFVVTLGIQ